MSMKLKSLDIVKATYRKDDGETSERQLLIISQPNPNFFTVDLSEADIATQVEVKKMLEKQRAEFDNLLALRGLKQKAFKPEGLTFTSIEHR